MLLLMLFYGKIKAFFDVIFFYFFCFFFYHANIKKMLFINFFFLFDFEQVVYILTGVFTINYFSYKLN
jgi:hypothetical protein